MIFNLYFRKKSFSGPYFLLCFLLLLLLWVPHVRAEEEETEHNIVEYFRLNRNIQREVNRLQDVEDMREERDEYRDEVIEWGREALDEIAPFFGRYEIRDPMIQHIKSPHRIMLTKRDEHVWVVGGLSLGDHFPLKEGLGMAWLAALEPGIMSAIYGLNRQAETLEAPGPWELGQAYSQQLIAEKNYQDVLLHFTEEEIAENEEQKLYTFIKETMEDLEELTEEIPFYYETGIEDYARLMNTIAGNPNTVKKPEYVAALTGVGGWVTGPGEPMRVTVDGNVYSRSFLATLFHEYIHQAHLEMGAPLLQFQPLIEPAWVTQFKIRVAETATRLLEESLSQSL